MRKLFVGIFIAAGLWSAGCGIAEALVIVSVVQVALMFAVALGALVVFALCAFGRPGK